jgi:NAD-dependent DNA ligase
MLIQPKIDGINLTYIPGNPNYLITRGDGNHGDDQGFKFP